MPARTSSSSENTKSLAADLARRILEKGPRSRGATVFALEGELGVGKTTFVQGFFKGLGLKRVPNSPTFILMRRTALHGKSFKNIFHIDAYRATAHDFRLLGLPELLSDPQNIFLIEWPRRIQKLLPKHAKTIVFSHGAAAHERKILL